MVLSTLMEAAPVAAQDNAVTASQEVRIQELEGQLRELNGQVEELNYHLQQMTDRLDKLVADMDFRLRQMEGGGEAMATPPDQVSEAQTPTSEAPAQSQPQQAAGDQAAAGAPQVLGTLSQSQLEARQQQLNTDADPAAAAAASAPATEQAAAATEPYALPGATADEQYQYAFDLLRQTKYADAEQALRTFVEQYPDHPLAGNASYWLGESYYVRRDYGNAALTFAEGFQKYPKSGKAPDSLLKLGMALAALGETADACKAFDELAARYPKASDGIKQRAAKERDKNGCQ
jgi:tol-pal system protein YbgF